MIIVRLPKDVVEDFRIKIVNADYGGRLPEALFDLMKKAIIAKTNRDTMNDKASVSQSANFSKDVQDLVSCIAPFKAFVEHAKLIEKQTKEKSTE